MFLLLFIPSYATLMYFSGDFLLFILCEFTGILNLWMVYFITSVKFSIRTSPNFACISFAFHSSSWAMIKNMLKLIDSHHVSFPYLSFWLQVQHFFFFQKTPEIGYFFWCILRSGILGSYGSSIFLSFLETLYCFPQQLYQFTFPLALSVQVRE